HHCRKARKTRTFSDSTRKMACLPVLTSLNEKTRENTVFCERGWEPALFGGLRLSTFSPDGRRLASGSFYRTLKVWDVTTGREPPRSERAQGRGPHRGFHSAPM